VENWTLLTSSARRSTGPWLDGRQVVRGTRLVPHLAMRPVTAIPPPPADTRERAAGPRTTSPGAHRRWLLAALPLCGIARPAFADGAIPSSGAFYGFFLMAAVLIILAIVVLIGLGRAIGNALQRRKDRPAKPASSAVPAARVVRDRSGSS
jgi:hypothetical protein